MTHKEKIEWMAVWAARHQLQLVLDGECGFGRKCVGVMTEGNYPEYEWYDDDYERADKNGDVWIPEDAYHKHPCVAVLGRGEVAEAQLFKWLKWFDDNGFKLETGDLPISHSIPLFLVSALGKSRYARMTKNLAE